MEEEWKFLPLPSLPLISRSWKWGIEKSCPSGAISKEFPPGSIFPLLPFWKIDSYFFPLSKELLQNGHTLKI
ncbi:MAG: hypothetical protein C6I01_01750 [Epsilonproteobacteria bacterium]|nr:hypothetical protein [Campylobacterota bacterium]